MKKILFLLLIPIFAFSQGWDTNNGLGVVPVTDTTGTPDIGILYFCFADSNYYSWKEGNYWAFVNEWTVENNTISLKDVSIDTIDIASSVIKAHVIYVDTSIVSFDSLKIALAIHKVSPTANEKLINVSTSDDASRFSVDEDGDIDADGTITTDSSNFNHTVINNSISVPSGSLEAADIALAQNNILVGNGSGQAAAGTDLPTATTIGLAYVYRVGGTDVADDDVVNSLTMDNGTVNNSIIGGVTPAAGTFTKLVANDSLRVEKTFRQKGEATFGATTTPVTIATDGNVTMAGVLKLGTAGVSLTHNSDGAVTLLGLGNGADENVTIDLDSKVDTIYVSSGTSASTLHFAGTLSGTSLSGGSITGTKLVVTDSLRVEKTTFLKDNVTLKTGKKLLTGTLQWTASGSDSIDGLKLSAHDFGDVTVDDGSWVVENDSHDHTTTISGKAANVSDADFGDVTVSTGAWAVEDDSHNHTTASTKFVITDSLRVEKTSLFKGNITLTTGDKLTFGTLQWTASGSDSIDGLKLAADNFGDVTVDDGSWAVKDDSHDHATTISGNAANVSDADFGDVSVSSGVWTVDVIDSVWNSITLGNDTENADGTINFVASDNDLGTAAITTDDVLNFTGFSGGLQYDSHILGYQASLGHGMTAIMGTDNFMKMTANDGGNGGTTIWSASTSSDGDDHAFSLRGITTDASITEPVIEFSVGKNSGTTWAGIGGTNPAFVFKDGSSELALLKTNGLLEVGSVAIGDTTTGDHDAILYFADDGSYTTESIKWDDGTSKFIASDDLDVTGRIQIDEIYHIYGGFEDSSAAVAITQDQWSQVTNAWGTLFGGSESDGFVMANDTVVVTNAGDYEGMVSLTFSGTNSNEYVFRIFDATTDTQKGFKLGTTADGTTNHAHISIPVYIEAAGNDSLVLQVTNTSGSNAATFEFGQFLLKYLHD